MSKKLTYLLTLVLILSLASSSTADEIHWTGAGTDSLWSNPDNWDLNRTTVWLDSAYIDYIEGKSGPIVDANLETWDADLGSFNDGDVNITHTAGTFICNGTRIRDHKEMGYIE